MRGLRYAAIAIVFAFGACLAFEQEPDTEGNVVGPDTGVVDRQPVYDLGVVPVVDPDTTVEESDLAIAPEGKAEKLVVVSATWCTPCHAYAATCKTLKAEGYDVEYNYVDTSEGKEKLKKYSNIKLGKSDEINYYKAYPTSFFIRDGNIIKKLEGVKSRRTVLETLWKSEDTKSVIDKILDKLPWNK